MDINFGQGLSGFRYDNHTVTGNSIISYNVSVEPSILDTINTLVAEMARMKDEVQMFKTREMVLTNIIKGLKEEIKRLYYA